MRPRFKLLTAAGLGICVCGAAAAMLTTESSSQAGSLPQATIQNVIRSSDDGSVAVRDVRAVRPDRFTTDSCKKATWPYIPEDCLRKGEQVQVRVLK
jgi:hypothetical protein